MPDKYLCQNSADLPECEQDREVGANILEHKRARSKNS